MSFHLSWLLTESLGFVVQLNSSQFSVKLTLSYFSDSSLAFFGGEGGYGLSYRFTLGMGSIASQLFFYNDGFGIK